MEKKVIKYLIDNDIAYSKDDFTLQDDGSGPYIASWDESALGPQPSDAEITSLPDYVSKADVAAEAGRRILQILPEWKQRNLTARAAQLSMKVASGAPLTTEEQAEWDAGEALWRQVQAIRDASNLIDKDDPISENFATDPRWPS